MARYQRMPTQEAGYTYAVVPCAPSTACLQKGGVHIRTFSIGKIGGPNMFPMTVARGVFANRFANQLANIDRE